MICKLCMTSLTLLYFVAIWYIFVIFGILYNEKSATLISGAKHHNETYWARFLCWGVHSSKFESSLTLAGSFSYWSIFLHLPQTSLGLSLQVPEQSFDLSTALCSEGLCVESNAGTAPWPADGRCTIRIEPSRAFYPSIKEIDGFVLVEKVE
jgi:hypothetical protein